MTANRVTEKQLQDMAAHLSNVTGLNITKGGAYGGTCFQIGTGSENLTGYVTKQQCMDWAHAFLKGLSIGYTKHKHDILKTQHGVMQELGDGAVCGDCGYPVTMRYETGWEIGISPFRWLCYQCYQNALENAPAPAPAPATQPSEPKIGYAPNGNEQRLCNQKDCTMPATHVLKYRRTGTPYYVGVNDLSTAEWCVFHVDEELERVLDAQPSA